MKSVSKLSLFVVILFGCFAGLILFFLSGNTPDVSYANALPGYPAPTQGTSAPQATPSSPNPYPPPLDTTPTSTPIPTIVVTPTANPTIPGMQPFEQAAIEFVASNEKINSSDLVFVESANIDIPFVDKKYWNGWVVNLSGAKQAVYNVIIDANRRMFLGNDGIDPQYYWQEAERYFEKNNRTAILRNASSKYDVPIENLEIAHGVLTYYSITGAIVWDGKITTIDKTQLFEITTDLSGKGLDLDPVQKAEDEAKLKKFGKLSNDLYYYLKAVPDDRKVQVMLWTKDIEYNQISQKLVEKFPSIHASRFAKGIPVDDKGIPLKLEKKVADEVDKEYRKLIKEALKGYKKDLIDDLKNTGFSPTDVEGLPVIDVALSKKDILTLINKHNDKIASFYLSAVSVSQENTPISVVHDTLRTDAAWSAYLQGGLARIGIGDVGVVRTDITHPALAGKIWANFQDLPTDEHATHVAGVLIGNDPGHPYQGVAFQNYQLYSAALYQGTQSELLNQLTWLSANTMVTNASVAFEGSQAMHWTDRAFDYISRNLGTLFVVAAGNYTGPTFGYNVRSPAKAYNVISVGGFDFQGDSNWANDIMWDLSCYTDPWIDGASYSGDREKPEVVAVGKNVEYPDPISGGYVNGDGTSIAAPQVTGLAALLIDGDYWLYNKPPLLKAIIMASADHNIEGDRRLSEKDGAGGVDVATAITFFQTGGYTYRSWYDINYEFSGSGNSKIFTSGDMTPPGGGNSGSAGGGSLFANQGDRIRAVISWESNPNSGLTTDALTSDLDLRVISPTGRIVASSLSYNNNYEIVDFNADETGDYSIKVTYINRGTEASDIGFGLSWIRISQVYLPVVMNN